MFAEVCDRDSIKPSENISATVICYKKDHGSIFTCPSTVNHGTTLTEDVSATAMTGTGNVHFHAMRFRNVMLTMTLNIMCFFIHPNKTKIIFDAETDIQLHTTEPRSTTVLFSKENPSSSNYPSYNNYTYTWVATKTSATLSFFFRHDPGGWMLDDVSVSHGSTELINDGGFETGNLNAWNYSGSCWYYTGQAYKDSSYAKSGSYYYYDRCRSHGDTISQTFYTVIGETYIISFWLTNYYCCGNTEIAYVTIV
ncbi:unnamed protein product [Adineta ricciae]|uniref:Uncharacterized protein n=1 Tax=Adineta ricciae TaxID=249248 RepID=A0A815GNU7_ADIRI|nr:unnamed protein product [Adineta ricciae]CAF1341347.1 unnamed protein product [Adineta ricciae]